MIRVLCVLLLTSSVATAGTVCHEDGGVGFTHSAGVDVNSRLIEGELTAFLSSKIVNGYCLIAHDAIDPATKPVCDALGVELVQDCSIPDMKSTGNCSGNYNGVVGNLTITIQQSCN